MFLGLKNVLMTVLFVLFIPIYLIKRVHANRHSFYIFQSSLLCTQCSGEMDASEFKTGIISDEQTDKETPACASGSYTIEASLILPLVLTAMALVMTLMQILAVQWNLSYAMQKSVREMTLWSDANVDRLHLVSVCNATLSETDLPEGWIRGGWLGLNYTASEITENEIHASVTCQVNCPLLLLGRHSAKLTATAYGRRWTGWNPQEGKWDGRHVYITPSGVAYHIDPSCVYLNPGMHSIQKGQISRERNASRQRYKPCKSCKAEKTAGNYVYASEYGETYHSTLTCHSLKRTVRYVTLQEARGYHACPKCAVHTEK